MVLEKLLTEKNIERGALLAGVLTFSTVFLMSKPSEEEYQKKQTSEQYLAQTEEQIEIKKPFIPPLTNRLQINPADHKLTKFIYTYRWHDSIKKEEQRENIPPYLLFGLIMHESHGNPLIVNPNSGATGLAQFMSRTGSIMGLRVYEDAGFWRSRRHAVKMIELARWHGCNTNNPEYEDSCDYEGLASIDERFNPEKSIREAARYLRQELFERHKTFKVTNPQFAWNLSLCEYHEGSKNPRITPYVWAVRANQAYAQAKARELNNAQ